MTKVIWPLVFLFWLTACKQKKEGMEVYEKLKQQEIEKGVRKDSLFFGIYLGMPSKDFFMHCWELNKKGIFTDGMNNTAVAYKMDSTQMGHPAHMFFYPDFIENKISEMRVTFSYDAWAPWNKYLFADSLLPRVLNLYRQWYKSDNDFIKMNDKLRGSIYIKIDGNRRITVGKADEMNVKVIFTDLYVEDKVLENLKK